MAVDRIICGDNVLTMATLPEECVDLVVTSPPYGDMRTYGGHSWDFEAVAAGLERVLKPGGVIVWVVGDQTKGGSESGTSFRQALHFMDIGLNLHDTMIYKSRKPPLTHNRYEQCFEYMFVISKGRPKTFNAIMRKNSGSGTSLQRDGSCASGKDGSAVRQREEVTIVKDESQKENIWFYNTGGSQSSIDPVAFNHPAIFPEALAGDHIISWSNPDDLVLDPFNGSGTTTKMARQLGRKFLGIEINEEYCDIARKRIAQGLLFS